MSEDLTCKVTDFKLNVTWYFDADIDAILHVNPYIDNRGLAMVFNPTLYTLSHNLTLPLYYTGLKTSVMVYHEGQETGQPYNLERDYSISFPLTMEPLTITWFLIKEK